MSQEINSTSKLSGKWKKQEINELTEIKRMQSTVTEALQDMRDAFCRKLCWKKIKERYLALLSMTDNE